MELKQMRRDYFLDKTVWCWLFTAIPNPVNLLTYTRID